MNVKKLLRPLLAAGLMISLALPASAEGYVYTFTIHASEKIFHVSTVRR